MPGRLPSRNPYRAINRPRSPFIPANPSRRSSVERSAACPTDRALFLLFVRVVLPESAHEPPTGGSPGGWHSVVARTSCCPHFHCAEWSCVVLSDPPRRRIGSGTDWPVKSPARPSVAALGLRLTLVRRPPHSCVARGGKAGSRGAAGGLEADGKTPPAETGGATAAAYCRLESPAAS